MSDLFTSGAHRPVQQVAAGARCLGEVLQRRAAESPDAVASFQKEGGRWRPMSWAAFYERTRQAAAGLLELGIAAGERISILGPTWTDWGVYDLGSQLAGLVTVGIYPHQSPEQVRYLLEHSQSRAVFVADAAELETVLAAAGGNRTLRTIVPWTVELAERYRARDERVTSPRRFRGEPLAEEAIAERLGATDGDDTAILIYTSGTTGPPKGAMITQANILSLLVRQNDVFAFFEDDLLLSFLPMAHATERILGFYSRVNTGVPTAYASSVGAVLDEVLEVRPTVFGSVPRLFEKAYAKIQGEVARKPAPVRAIFAWADAVGRRRLRRQLAGRPIPPLLELRYRLAHRLVFAKIHAAFGGRVRACITGAAPISSEILEFLWGAGLPVYEGYGMTEATVITHICRPGAVKLGTVGRPISDMECRTAEDGEILLRGPLVFKGYLGNEDATRETLADGWLHTGDVGEVDAEGFLRITDRKKHLIITAGGKNVAPANIERAIKTQSPLISQVHAHGDRRAFVTALIAPSPLEALEWGVGHGLLEPSELSERRRELIADPTARSEALQRDLALVAGDRRFPGLFTEPVRRGNRELARVERVRRFYVLDHDFSQEGGEMTPTMKMKRKAIEEKHAELFDRLYEDPTFGIDAGEAGK